MDVFAVYFSSGRDAMAQYLLSHLGVKLDELSGEEIDDAQSALDLDEREIVTIQPEGSNWCVLLGDISLAFNEEKTEQCLSAASKGGEVLMILSQDVTGGAWFEYHKDGQLHRKWVEIESEVEANIGEPLNDFDAEHFTDEIDEEEGPPDTWELVELAEGITGIPWDDLSAPGTLYRLPAQEEKE